MATFRTIGALRRAYFAASEFGTPEIIRVGPRQFVLQPKQIGNSKFNSNEDDFDFVYGKGFKQVFDQSAHQDSTADATGSARRRLKPSPSVITLVCIAVVGLGLVAYGNLAKMQSIAGPKGFGSIVASSSAKSAVKVAQKSTTSAGAGSNTCQSAMFLAQTALKSAEKSKNIIADQIIGGFRELTIADSCTNQKYQVVFYLDGKTWKAKSATPVGSHSLGE